MGYIVLLAFLLVFVHYAQNRDVVEVVERTKEKKTADKTRNVDVSFELYSTTEGTKPVLTHRIQMSNQDSISDLLRKLRSEDVISYEITEYTDRVEINHVNNIFPQFGTEWAVFYEGKNITSKVASINLQNDKTYSLNLIHTEELQ